MSTKNNFKFIFYIVLAVVSVSYDVLLGDQRYPVVTLIVCAILILYERVSPFIYFTR